MKKILFITPSLRAGGAEKNMVNIINAINKNIFLPILIICGKENNYDQLLPESIKVYKFNKNSTKHSIPDIIRVIKKEQPNIVFTSSGHLNSIIIIIKVLLRIEFISIARIPTLPNNRLSTSYKSLIVGRLNKLLYRKFDYLIAQSSQMKNQINKVYKIANEKIITVPNIVNEKQIKTLANKETNSSFKDEEFNIVAVGTLYSIKGFDLLIKAIKITILDIPNIRLHLVGGEGIEKNYKKYLEGVAEKEHVADHITFHGFQKNPYPFIRNADLFILSSRKEGFPNVVLEALVLKKIVIATNCVEFDGIISDYKNGIVVPANDVSSLSRGILDGKKLLNGNSYEEYRFSNFDYTQWFKEILQRKS